MIQLTKDTVFDYKTHKENFINYLEVIIFKDGHIEYCVPSHQEKLIDVYTKEYNITREELGKKIPIFDSPMHWILFEMNIICVWWDYILRPVEITKEQQDALDKLRQEGLISSYYNSNVVYLNDYGKINIKEEI